MAARTKADQCYEILKARIVDGTYGPGYRLVIDQLSREHDISANPWRESVRRLEAEGWVEVVPHAGALVRALDVDSQRRTIQLLARLEGLATALSAERLTAADIDAARQVNTEMAHALSDFETARFEALDRRFHELLCTRCDDPRLSELLTTEWTRLDIVRRSSFGRATAPAGLVDEHARLLDMVVERAEPDAIESAARGHRLSTHDGVGAGQPVSR